MLQIEIFRRDDLRLSKSVTRGVDLAELLLQIKIIQRDGLVCLNL